MNVKNIFSYLPRNVKNIFSYLLRNVKNIFSYLPRNVKNIFSYLPRNVKVGGRGRLVLSPTMSELPLVGGIQFFFLTKPEIDFDFDGLAKIADLPVIKAKIKEDLLEDLNKHAVYPNRFG